MSISLAWSLSSGATAYTVYRSTDGSRGTAIGSVVAPPFVDAAAVAGTGYTYGVTASDAAGESALSVQVQATMPLPAASPSPTTSPSPAPSPTPLPTPTLPMADFNTRRSAPGVLRSFSFDTLADQGTFSQTQAWPDNTGIAWQAGDDTNPTLDTTVKASGASSLRFDVPSLSSANAAGAWLAKFSADDSVVLGQPGSLSDTVYVQWRVRLNDAMQDTVFNDVDGGQIGPKIGGLSDAFSTDTNTIPKIVMMGDWFGQRIFNCYQYNGFNGSTQGSDAGMREFLPVDTPLADWTDFTPQDGNVDAGNNPVCLRYGSGPTPDWSKCIGTVANEWQTLQLRLTAGAIRTDAPWNGLYRDVTFEWWYAREGQPSRLIHRWDPTVHGYTPCLCSDGINQYYVGKFQFWPYITRKDPAQVHPLAQMHLDEVVFSTQRIADPAPAMSSTPAWRSGLVAGTLNLIPNTQNFSGQVSDAQSSPASSIINAWCSLAASSSTLLSTRGGGHRDGWRNMALALDLSRDEPGWVVLHSGSDISAIVDDANYYADGRPSSSHTYYAGQFCAPRNTVMQFGAGARWSSSGTAGYKIDGYDLAKNEWAPAGTFPAVDGALNLRISQEMACAIHPVTGDAYFQTLDATFQNYGGLVKWTQATNTLALWRVPDGRSWWNFNAASCIDVARNRWVSVQDGLIHSLDLATTAVIDVPLTGVSGLPDSFGALCHDTDNDRYLYCNGFDLYGIDPATGATTLLTAITGTDLTGFHNRMHFHSAVGGVTIMPSYAAGVYFFPTR